MSKLKLLQITAVAVVLALLSGAALAQTGRTGNRPSAPRDLTARPGAEPRTITLSWKVPASEGGASILGYNIYRSDSADTFRLVAQPGEVLDYTDSGLSAGTRYRYWVSAFNEREGNLSEEASAVASQWATPSATTPGEDGELSIPPISKPATQPVEAQSPPVILQAICSHELCWTEITVPSQSFTVPGSEPKDYSTPPVPVPESCAVVVCVGPFTIPSQTYHSNDRDPIIVQTPAHNEPAVCKRDEAQRICAGPTTVPGMTFTLVPATDSLGLTPPINIRAGTSGFAGYLAPYIGEGSVLLQPFVVIVASPFGGIPVTVCPSTCQAPLSPRGELTGSVTVEISIGDTTVSSSRAVQIAF